MKGLRFLKIYFEIGQGTVCSEFIYISILTGVCHKTGIKNTKAMRREDE